MPPDDVGDNDENASSYNEDGSMKKKSSDSKGIKNMVESYTPGESKLTQIKPLNNKQRYEACSSIHKNKNRGDTTSNFEDKNMRDTPADFEDETMRDASSNFEDEAMRDESSQDGEGDDVDRPPAGKNELRLSRVKGPNEILESKGQLIYDEYEDPFSKVQARMTHTKLTMMRMYQDPLKTA